jgi:hypothetical protein
MFVLVVLLVSWLALRGIGAAGVHALGSWQDSARYALVLMFIFTATAHFNKMKHDLARMIPSSFPHPMLIVYITGVLELLGAAGLVLSQFRRLAGICLIDCAPRRDVHRQCKCGTARRHTARQASDTALVAGSNADFVYCATLVVNSRLNGTTHRHADSKNFLICTQYLLTM